MTIKSVKQMVAEADEQVEVWSREDVFERLDDPHVQLVDIRDIRELWREGTIPGATHAPRGMLEFWFDPQSPYAKPQFQEEKVFVLFCASAWRSALAAKTLTDMGLERIAHMQGGFSGWKGDGLPVESKDPPATDQQSGRDD